MTWRWLLDGVVIAIHDEQIATSPLFGQNGNKK